ncbi:F0F1 ATP synthase subunit B [Benzoatithermus flavus]|uniref:ATP synthase subunit b n=1 Tax=Benzoatithermus flavus TaxID=3108223 RepID=A0ABU8XQA8_9PROT
MLELVLLICLIVLIVLVWKPVKRSVLGALDARAEKIRSELDEAQRLHEEAKALLAKYQRQLHEGEKLAQDILAQAEAQQKRFEEKMRADYEAAVKRRTDLAMERIAQEEARALQEVRTRAADLAIRTTRRLLTERVGEAEAQTLVRGAIEEVKRKLA